MTMYNLKFSLFPFQVIIVALVKMDSAYSFSNLHCRGKACKTNLPSNTAFRGFGFPQTGMITETIMDAVAAKCGLPPDQVDFAIVIYWGSLLIAPFYFF